MLVYSVIALWLIGGQHGVAACDEICKDMTARMGEVEDWMTNFDVRIIKFTTSVMIRRKLAGNTIGCNTVDVRALLLQQYSNR